MNVSWTKSHFISRFVFLPRIQERRGDCGVNRSVSVKAPGEFRLQQVKLDYKRYLACRDMKRKKPKRVVLTAYEKNKTSTGKL
ncbi:Dymeclin [Clarias magur]|uniref:Dymeclin n=1 Tax=Clarias magur TaxID=1594786 RepID=A0A8J4T8W3_CLAMG|nr:Dymeclin [Clarias magur]